MVDLTEDARSNRETVLARLITGMARLSDEERALVLRRIAARTNGSASTDHVLVEMPPTRTIIWSDGTPLDVDAIDYRLEETACAICEQPLIGHKWAWSMWDEGAFYTGRPEHLKCMAGSLVLPTPDGPIIERHAARQAREGERSEP